MARSGNLATWAFVGGLCIMIGMAVVLFQVVLSAADGDTDSFIGKTFKVGNGAKKGDTREDDWEYFEQHKKAADGEPAAGIYQKPEQADAFAELDLGAVGAGLAGIGLTALSVALVVYLGRTKPQPRMSTEPPVPRHTSPGAPVADTGPGGNPAIGAGGDNLHLLRERDVAFSRPVLAAFLQNLHRTAYHAAVQHDWQEARTWIEPEVQALLERSSVDIRELGETVLESMAVQVVATTPIQELRAELSGFREERGLDARLRVLRFHERWTLVRPDHTVSAAPDLMVALACPACFAHPGATEEDGTCVHCHAPVVDSGLVWKVVHAEVFPRRPVETIQREARHTAHGSPLVRLGDVHRQLADLGHRVPGFDSEALIRRAIDMFYVIHGACRNGEWRATRPWCTDIAYEQIRYGNESYEMAGHTNVREHLQLDRLEVVRVDEDAFYTSISIRFWWKGLDFVLDPSGQVLEGSPNHLVADSAVWTFQRANGQGSVGGELAACPSCGASVDRVDGTGTCQSCQTWLCDGQHHWVLARIDAVATWNGV